MKVYKDNNDDDDREKRSLHDLFVDSIHEIGFFIAVITIIIIAFGIAP